MNAHKDARRRRRRGLNVGPVLVRNTPLIQTRGGGGGGDSASVGCSFSTPPSSRRAYEEEGIQRRLSGACSEHPTPPAMANAPKTRDGSEGSKRLNNMICGAAMPPIRATALQGLPHSFTFQPKPFSSLKSNNKSLRWVASVCRVTKPTDKWRRCKS